LHNFAPFNLREQQFYFIPIQTIIDFNRFHFNNSILTDSNYRVSEMLKALSIGWTDIINLTDYRSITSKIRTPINKKFVFHFWVNGLIWDSFRTIIISPFTDIPSTKQ
jgi:hypothetical protein